MRTALADTDSVQTFIAQKFQRQGADVVDTFYRTFNAAGVLCSGQQMIKSVLCKNTIDRSDKPTTYSVATWNILEAQESSPRNLECVSIEKMVR